MEYKFNNDTLTHSIGFNPLKLENVLQNGILSFNQASKLSLVYTRNFYGSNLNDYISMTKINDFSFEDDSSSYNLYTKNTVSVIVEDTPYEIDRGKFKFNHIDEVYVKDRVNKEKIIGILVPSKYKNYPLYQLPHIHSSATSYQNIKKTADNLLKYLENLGYEPDYDEYNEILRYMYYSLTAYNKTDHPLEQSEIFADFEDSKEELNEFLATSVNETFIEVLGKDNPTLMDMVNYINDKTLKTDIYELPTKIRNGRYAR